MPEKGKKEGKQGRPIRIIGSIGTQKLSSLAKTMGSGQILEGVGGEQKPAGTSIKFKTHRNQ
jgi:hypothetical protein